MGETIQPGAKVDKETYKRFKQFVEDTHGRVRGSLADELEIAMKQRMEDANGPDRLARIENDIATLKAQLADAESDGGEAAPTPAGSDYTHARDDAKPAANQPRAVKYEYLIEQLFAGKRPESPSGGELAPKDIRRVVTDNYDIDEAIVEEWVEGIQKRLGSDFDAEPHPDHGKTLVWGERLAELRNDADAPAEAVA